MALLRAKGGGFVLMGTNIRAGTGREEHSGRKEMWILATDARGKLLWERTYRRAGGGRGGRLALVSDGGFIAVGAADVRGAGREELWLVRTDARGKRLWDRTYGGGDLVEPTAVAVTADGGFAAAGSTVSQPRTPYGLGDWDARLVLTDEKGKLKWDRTYGGVQDDHAHQVVALPHGGFALAGYTNRHATWTARLWRIDHEGTLLWEKSYSSSGWSTSVNDLALLPDGGFILAGVSTGPGRGDMWLLRTNAQGEKLWERTFSKGAELWESASAVTLLPDGGFALAGSATAPENRSAVRYWLVRTDREGRRLWDVAYAWDYSECGACSAYAADMAVLPDGGFALAGTTSATPMPKRTEAAWLVRADSKGKRLWDAMYRLAPQ